MFNGKIHYKWPFSIAMLVYQRVVKIPKIMQIFYQIKYSPNNENNYILFLNKISSFSKSTSVKNAYNYPRLYIPYYPILSHIIPYYPILSHIIPYYYPILSHIIIYYHILSYIIPYYPTIMNQPSLFPKAACPRGRDATIWPGRWSVGIDESREGQWRRTEVFSHGIIRLLHSMDWFKGKFAGTPYLS